MGVPVKAAPAKRRAPMVCFDVLVDVPARGLKRHDCLVVREDGLLHARKQGEEIVTNWIADEVAPDPWQYVAEIWFYLKLRGDIADAAERHRESLKGSLTVESNPDPRPVRDRPRSERTRRPLLQVVS